MEGEEDLIVADLEFLYESESGQVSDHDDDEVEYRGSVESGEGSGDSDTIEEASNEKFGFKKRCSPGSGFLSYHKSVK